jgi:hypothetical protein
MSADLEVTKRTQGYYLENTQIYWTQRDQRIISSNIEQHIARATAGEIARARIMNNHGNDTLRPKSTTASPIY